MRKIYVVIDIDAGCLECNDESIYEGSFNNRDEAEARRHLLSQCSYACHKAIVFEVYVPSTAMRKIYVVIDIDTGRLECDDENIYAFNSRAEADRQFLSQDCYSSGHKIVVFGVDIPDLPST